MRDEVLSYIFERCPTQRKKMERALERNRDMAEDLKRFLERYSVFMRKAGITYHDLADAYLLMIDQIFQARLEFIRTGRYPAASEKAAFRDVYDNPKIMTSYMLGLAFSQFIWEHHYRIYRFYQSVVSGLAMKRFCLEIGSGHGLYTLELLKTASDLERLDIADISDTSIDLTRSIISALIPDRLPQIFFTQGDIRKFVGIQKYDFIAMGEVLEHVEEPAEVLNHLRNLMKSDGRVFITTCANCPTMDHVTHFAGIDDIRKLIRRAEFGIVQEAVFPSEDLPLEQIEKRKIDISYAALLAGRE